MDSLGLWAQCAHSQVSARKVGQLTLEQSTPNRYSTVSGANTQTIRWLSPHFEQGLGGCKWLWLREAAGTGCRLRAATMRRAPDKALNVR